MKTREYQLAQGGFRFADRRFLHVAPLKTLLHGKLQESKWAAPAVQLTETN